MEETNTQIAWPSKLKIGAKSKKGKSWEIEKLVALIMETGITGSLQGRKSTFILIMYVPRYLWNNNILEGLS